MALIDEKTKIPLILAASVIIAGASVGVAYGQVRADVSQMQTRLEKVERKTEDHDKLTAVQAEALQTIKENTQKLDKKLDKVLDEIRGR